MELQPGVFARGENRERNTKCVSAAVLPTILLKNV